MFLFKNKTLNSLINSFKSWEDSSKKSQNAEIEAFTCLENWSSDGNNVAIQDVSGKLMTLYAKLNNDSQLNKSVAIDEMVELFKNFKEYDIKLNKLKEKIADIEKLEKKREKELEKCPINKNIRDYEVRLYHVKSEKERLELEYYELLNEVEAAKTILFKNNFIKFYNALLKRNKAEEIVLNAMNKLINEIPDLTNHIQIKDVSYGNFEQTNDVFNDAIFRLNNLTLENNSVSYKESKSQLKQRKKLKTRISCPQITTNLYPNLDALKNTHENIYTVQRSNTIAYKIMPTAPPQSDIEQKKP